jgi:hypothetical protein
MNVFEVPTVSAKVRRFAGQVQCSVVAVILINAYSWCALAQDTHSHSAAQQNENTAEQQKKLGALIKTVREATERFKDVSAAEAEGYGLQFGCVSGPDKGAMGLHYVNSDLVNRGVLDATTPQIVIYEPTPSGGLKLIGADFLLIASAWDAAHESPPELMGQLFQYWESPNRFGLPAFYTLHVWAWKDNPNGAFVNWHPHVSCQSFAGQNP